MRSEHTPQAKKSREKKNAIYQTCMQLFSEHGYEQTTIRDICKACNITNSTFYNFFGDKKGVLLQFYYEVLSKGSVFLEPSPENLEHPFQAVCNFFIHTTMHQISFNQDVARICILNLPAMTAGNYDSLHSNAGILDIAAFFNAAKKTGRIHEEFDSYRAAEYLLAAANGISIYWLTLTRGESYLNVARRLMPTAFSAVSDEPVKVPEISDILSTE